MSEALPTSHLEASASVKSGFFGKMPEFLKRILLVGGALVIAAVVGHAIITPP